MLCLDAGQVQYGKLGGGQVCASIMHSGKCGDTTDGGGLGGEGDIRGAVS